MQLETWLPITGFENEYMCSNHGKVKSLPRNGTVSYERILKPKLTWDGYYEYALQKHGKSKYVRAHVVVARAFLENPNNYPQVNHKDGNKLNNCVDNLEWCTLSHNVRHAYNMGLNPKRFGKENDKSKKVYQYTLDGIFVKQWDSCREIERQLGIPHCNVCACCTGRYKKSHGFIWKYAKEGDS